MKREEIIREVKQEMANRRHKAQTICEEFISSLEDRDEKFRTLFMQYNLNNLNLIKSRHNKENLTEAEEKFNSSKDALYTYLKSKNINPHRLSPQYKCKKCEDKGIVNGKMCSCLSDEINRRISKNNSSYTKFHTFSMINPLKMNDNTTQIYKEMSKWCDDFPNDIINIFLIGRPGTGKTFLLECITSKLIDLNKNVIFTTAFDFNEECRKYHFSQPNNVDNFINCDALIIDDLGTEPVLKNITSEYLYNIINLRQIKNKATLISTNLDLDQLIIRYSARTISRLNNKSNSKSYMFLGQDKRAY